MVMEYVKSRVEVCAERIYQTHSEAGGLDGLSTSAHSRGLEAVREFIADYTLSAVLEGLGVGLDSTKGRRIMAAYVDGSQRLDPAEFPSAMNRGKTRKLR